jgi:hypothetical protein
MNLKRECMRTMKSRLMWVNLAHFSRHLFARLWVNMFLCVCVCVYIMLIYGCVCTVHNWHVFGDLRLKCMYACICNTLSVIAQTTKNIHTHVHTSTCDKILYTSGIFCTAYITSSSDMLGDVCTYIHRRHQHACGWHICRAYITGSSDRHTYIYDNIMHVSDILYNCTQRISQARQARRATARALWRHASRHTPKLTRATHTKSQTLRLPVTISGCSQRAALISACFNGRMRAPRQRAGGQTYHRCCAGLCARNMVELCPGP